MKVFTEHTEPLEYGVEMVPEPLPATGYSISERVCSIPGSRETSRTDFRAIQAPEWEAYRTPRAGGYDKTRCEYWGTSLHCCTLDSKRNIQDAAATMTIQMDELAFIYGSLWCE